MILNIPKNITDQLFFRDFVFFAQCDNVFFAQCDNDGHEQYFFVIFMYFLKTKEWKLSQWWTPDSQANVGRKDAFEDQVVSDSA